MNTYDLISALADRFDNDFNKEKVLGSLCFTSDNQLKFTRNKINELISEVRDIREHYTGSEAQTSYMEGKMDYISTLEEQWDEMHDLHESAQDVFEAVVGKRWIKPAKKSTLDKTKTAAAEAADALLAKYA